MTSNFLDKFQGKMTTISKLGIENLFKGKEDSSVYTNTVKTFNNKSISRPSKIQRDTEEIQKPQTTQPSDDKRSIHLPSIGERYRSHEERHHPGRSVYKNSHGHIDKETNWFIEDNLRSGSPVSKHNSTTNKLIVQKENIQKVILQKKKDPNCNKTMGKIQKLGGLGPNIGSEEWQLRHSKQQKALNYAKNLRKVHRERVKQERQEPTFLTFNGRNITMQ